MTKIDKYINFDQLLNGEDRSALRIVEHPRKSKLAVLAPHGGKIEPLTSEIATAIAAGQWSLYLFEGRKRTGNRALHITSHRFDEPKCRAIVKSAETVLTIHGKQGEISEVLVGGLDLALSDSIRQALQRQVVQQHYRVGPAAMLDHTAALS